MRPIDDYGELRCRVCDTVICCDECGDMRMMCALLIKVLI